MSKEQVLSEERLERFGQCPCLQRAISNVEKLRGLPWLIAGGCLNSIFCSLTVFGSVFILFLNVLGLDKARIGLLLSMFPFCGLVAPLVAARLERHGFKRSFLTLWSIRQIVVVLLLLAPRVLSRAGPDMAFAWVTGIILVFALCRALAETAYYPWCQEAVPDYVRGKFSSTASVSGTVCAMAALFLAGRAVGKGADPNMFLLLLALGCAAGILQIFCYLPVPGGNPVPGRAASSMSFREIGEVFRDANYVRFLCGLGLAVFAASAFFSFLPLLAKESVGLTAQNVVRLDVAANLGLILSSFFWGWAADRYGSKPVMLSGLWILLVLPACWFFVPRGNSSGLPAAFSLSFVAGIGTVGWATGWGRYLNVRAVPRENSAGYMAVFYAWIGLAGGLATILSGRFLDYCRDLQTTVFSMPVDVYTPLLVIACLMILLAIVFVSNVEGDGPVPFRVFLGLFFRSNPLTGLESVVRYRLAEEESKRLSTTERLGVVRTPLGFHELREALADPSFNVRFQAVIATARMRPSPGLVDELLRIAGGPQRDLAATALWALGRLRDNSTVLPLRDLLLSEDPLLKSGSARALASLGDTASIPVFRKGLREENDESVQAAFASALGVLRAGNALEDVLAFLSCATHAVVREETALSVARLLGKERYYIRLWRRSLGDASTVFCQALRSAAAVLRRLPGGTPVALVAGRAAREFEEGRSVPAGRLLAELFAAVSALTGNAGAAEVLDVCGRELSGSEGKGTEYILLGIHALNIVCGEGSLREGQSP